MSRSMLVAAARADKSLFFCCESDFKIVSPASSVSVAILCACSNVSDKWSALDTEAIKTSRRSSSFKTANALLLLLLLFLPPPLFDSTSPPEGKSNCWCCLKEARSVYLKEENEQSRSKRERESKRERDDDVVVVVVVVVVVDVKFHSAGPRESHSFFPRKKNITQQTRREKESLKRKEKKEKPFCVPARSHRRVVAF